MDTACVCTANAPCARVGGNCVLNRDKVIGCTRRGDSQCPALAQLSISIDCHLPDIGGVARSIGFSICGTAFTGGPVSCDCGHFGKDGLCGEPMCVFSATMPSMDCFVCFWSSVCVYEEVLCYVFLVSLLITYRRSFRTDPRRVIIRK